MVGQVAGVEVEERLSCCGVGRSVAGRVGREAGDVVVRGSVVASGVRTVAARAERRPEVDGALADLAVARAGVIRGVIERVDVQFDEVVALPVVAERPAGLRVRERVAGDVGGAVGEPADRERDERLGVVALLDQSVASFSARCAFW